MKTAFVKLCLAMMIIIAGSVPAVTIDVYSGHTQTRGGTPYTDLVGSFHSPDIMFWTNSNHYWFPFSLPNFGAEITGYLLVSATGTYEFELTCDDGTIVFIDDQEFFTECGGDGLKTGVTESITLTEGTHPFRIEFFEDWGSTSGIDFILPDGVQYSEFGLVKTDGVPEEECRSPEDEIHYEICFVSDANQVLVDPFVIDYLPDGVDYDYILSLNPLVLDENYNSEEHYYLWELDDIALGDANCLELTVTVNYNAIPGGTLHNVAQLWGTLLVPDPNDPNNVSPQLCMVAEAIRDTKVCCWQNAPNVLYVDKSAVNGAKNGLDWANAFLDLQDALEYARSQVCGDVNSIYIAQETYSPGDSEDDSFDLRAIPGIRLYGGFSTGGCDPNLRDPKKYVTTLSGKIDDTHRNTTVLVMGNNTYLDGFTVMGASQEGYGIYGSGVDCSVVNCTIKENEDIGAYIENGNAEFRWCRFMNNKGDGIRHTGESFVLSLENCSVRQSGRYGIACANSTPSIINSTIIESDVAQEGRSGLFMEDPTGIPYIQNCTFAHNKSAGLDLFGDRIPNIQNTIVYHNGGPALVGFTADQAASYCCITDCNEVNNNINDDPQLAYFDPNNVRIRFDSPCHDTGLTLTENYTQVDMDNRTRVLGNDVDRGAYEIECEDSTNSYDLDADGLVNLHEFNGLSRAWLSHDPNDPVWLANPNLADTNLSEGWYEWKYKYNFDSTGGSQYAIDLADLIVLVEDAPWLWRACWLTNEELAAMTTGSEQLSMLSSTGQPEIASTLMQEFSATTATADIIGTEEAQSVTESAAEPELSVEEQISQLRVSIEFLEQIWKKDPSIRQEIDAKEWNEFMNTVYKTLTDLKTEAVQIE